MRPLTQDYSARTSVSSPSFDCELPEHAREEILRPRRPRILEQPPSPPQKPPQVNSGRSRGHPALGWLLALAGVVTLFVLIGLSWPSPAARDKALQESADRQRETEAAASRALEALRKSAPQPTPAPIVQPTPAATPAVTAPRARLVRLPAPPPWRITELTPSHIDESHVLMMPYGLEVRATLRGFLGALDQLPRVGHIGDMYIVENFPWIWLQVPGTSVPTWVDP